MARHTKKAKNEIKITWLHWNTDNYTLVNIYRGKKQKLYFNIVWSVLKYKIELGKTLNFYYIHHKQTNNIMAKTKISDQTVEEKLQILYESSSNIEAENDDKKLKEESLLKDDSTLNTIETEEG